MWSPDDGPDALDGAENPARDLGPLVPERAARDAFSTTAREARMRFAETFGPLPESPAGVVETIERTLAAMWEEGWSPEEGNLKLFVLDFGALLADAVASLGGELLMREGDAGIHSSVFFRGRRLEVFPWHRMLKRLRSREGESVLSYFTRVRDLTQGKPSPGKAPR